ncbi:MAG: protein translocase subunit SecD [Bacteroidetes bacterium]|nr:protein translocase subunit SecD [Bacteroidota bacterium]
MRNQLSRIVITVCFVILAVYFLWPTIQDYNYRKELSRLNGADSIAYAEKNHDDMLEAKLKRMKLGLDLQGGMRVVLEVDIIQLLNDIAKNRDDNFNTIIKEVRTETSANEVSVIPVFIKKFQDRGIRLSRYYGNIRDDDDKIISMLEDETEKAVDRAIEIVRNRVDQYGVSEPGIQKQGGRRIIVALPGVKDENEVRQLLRGTALLEFRLLKDPQISYKVMDAIDRYLTGKTDLDTAAAASAKDKEKKEPEKRRDALTELTGGTTVSETDTSAEAQIAREHPFYLYVRPDQQGNGEGYVAEKDRDRVVRLLERPEVQNLIPADFEFLWSAKVQTFRDEQKFYILYPVKKTPELTGNVITNAQASVDPEDNRSIVNMEMNSEGSREWARITGANIGKRIAIILDKGVFSAPVVQGKIPGGRSRITGMDSPSEARLLEIVLKAGALPAPVTTIEQRSVGPSLGEDSIKAGMNSTIIAIIFTILFMIVYYRSAGAVADFALIFNILFILGVMAGFQATLTLPGIAGIVLTIGMAVDANVLINERIREEMAGGKTLRAAIDAGYEKAFSAIIDSNITTFLTGLVLYQFGTGPVQGFALTLMIGIGASLFSAIIITHVIFNIMTEKGVNPNFG